MKNQVKNKMYYSILLLIICCFSCEENDYHSEDLDTSVSSTTDIKINLTNGTILHFGGIQDEDVEGTFLLEESNCVSCSSLDQLAELTNTKVSVEEVFWAFSKPGTPIPDFMSRQEFFQKKSFVLEQGWAAEKSISPIIIDGGDNDPIVACKNFPFTSSIKNGFLGQPEFVELDKTPNNYDAFINDCGDLPASLCNHGPRYTFNAEMHAIKKWRGKICARSLQNTSNNHNVSNHDGGFCQSPPCTNYVGPEVYFERLKNGKWISLKNTANGSAPGFEVPANTTKTYSYAFSVNKKTSFRLRVKNAMGMDQFDFMMDQPDPVLPDPDEDDDPGQGEIPQFPYELLELPAGLEIVYSNADEIIVDFLNQNDQNPPKISIPKYFLPEYLPYHEDGDVLFPNNFCGLRILHADGIAWLDQDNEILNDDVYNYIHEDSSILNEQYPYGIEFTGAFGVCEDDNSWYFPSPFLKKPEFLMYNGPVRLVIQLSSFSRVEFLDYNVDLSKSKKVDPDKLFKGVDFDKIVKYYNYVFYEYFDKYVEKVCADFSAATNEECPFDD